MRSLFKTAQLVDTFSIEIPQREIIRDFRSPFLLIGSCFAPRIRGFLEQVGLPANGHLRLADFFNPANLAEFFEYTTSDRELGEEDLYHFDDDREWPDTMQVSLEYAGDGSLGRPKLLIYEQRLWSTN